MHHQDEVHTLYIAVKTGNLQTVKSLLKDTNLNINELLYNGNTMLQLAIFYGRFDVAKWLVENTTAEVNKKTLEGDTALHLASKKGHLAIVKWLVEIVKVDVNETTQNGKHALHLAAINDQVNIVSWLAEFSPIKVDAKDHNGWNALHFAAQQGHLSIVKYLTNIFSMPINVNEKENKGWTALHFAAIKGHLAVVKYLVNTLAIDVNAVTEANVTALHCAINGGHLSIVQWLIEHTQAEIQFKINSHYFTPLHLAILTGHLDIVAWLYEKYDMDVTKRLKYINNFLLQLAATRGEHLPILQWLVENKKMDITKKSRDGRTILHIAASKGLITVVEYLISTGLNLTERTSNGDTALLFAAKGGHLSLIQWLLTHGASLAERDNNQETILFAAVKGGNLPLVRWLLEEQGCLELIDKVNKDQASPLLGAASSGHFEIVQYLISQGASFKVCNDNKETVLFCAAKAGNVNLVQWLLEQTECQKLMEMTDRYGMTPLLAAAKAGHLAVVQHLISQGALLITQDLRYPLNVLIYAAEAGHLAIVQWLIEAGGCSKLINAPDYYGDTALSLAANKGQLPIVQYLISQGALTTIINNQEQSVLLVATQNHHLAVVRWLIEEGGCRSIIDMPDRNNNTALLYAAQQGYSDITQYLINQGASLTNKGKYGSSVAFHAANHGDVKTLKLLSQKGILLSECRNNYGSSPLGWAVSGGNHFEAIKYLLEQGCSIDERASDEVEEDMSLLRFAIKNLHSDDRNYGDEKERSELIEFLLEKTLAMTTYAKLSLTSINLSSLQWEKFIPLLKNHPIITEIDLSYLTQADQPALLPYVCELLNENSTLISLSLNGNSWIDDETVAQLAEAVANNNVLKRLTLVDCQLTDKGVQTLLDKLIVNQTLTELPLKTDNYNTNEVSESLEKPLAALLERNCKKAQAESMADWTNLLRNVKADDQTIDPNLPRARTEIASLQGYCTFFARKLRVTTAFNPQEGWQAYYNNQRMELSQIAIEAMATGKHEQVNMIPIMRPQK